MSVVFSLILLIILVLLGGAALLLFVPRTNTQALRGVALVAALVALGAAGGLVAGFVPQQVGFQHVTSLAWVPQWGLGITLGVDGISLWLVVLTTLLLPITLVVAWQHEDAAPRAQYALLLVLAAATVGVFTALDLVLFYVFFEATLVPAALLIAGWGGAGRRAAATKFFVYTFAGSVVMLIGIIGLYLAHGEATGSYTFDYRTLLAALADGRLVLDTPTERALFGAFAVAFLVKLPIWPLHTWMIDAHAAAPTSGVVDVAAMMLKIGAYGLLRFGAQLFPQATAWAAPAIGTLALISIIYAAWVAYHQTDMKLVLAYASMSHLGFVVLGILSLSSIGVLGAVLQIINSGITTSALFLAVGMIAKRRGGSRMLDDAGGLLGVAPVLGALVLTLGMASIGLPGLNGFIGEYAIMQGVWVSPLLGWHYAAVAVIGVILSAAYMLRMYRGTFFGEARAGATTDLTRAEFLVLLILLVPTVAIGLYPNALLSTMQPTAAGAAQLINALLAIR